MIACTRIRHNHHLLHPRAAYRRRLSIQTIAGRQSLRSRSFVEHVQHARCRVVLYLNLIQKLVSGRERLCELGPASLGRGRHAGRCNPVHLSGDSCLYLLRYPDQAPLQHLSIVCSTSSDNYDPDFKFKCEATSAPSQLIGSCAYDCTADAAPFLAPRVAEELLHTPAAAWQPMMDARHRITMDDLQPRQQRCRKACACLVTCWPELSEQCGAKGQIVGGLQGPAVQQRQGAALHRRGQPCRRRKWRKRMALDQQRTALRLLHQ